MMPPMHQTATAFVPVLDAAGKIIPDRYGRPQTKKISSVARVTFKERTIRNAQGVETRIGAEIDVPPDFIPPTGSEIEYVSISRQTFKGRIEDMDEAPNLDASEVYYRTLLVSG